MSSTSQREEKPKRQGGCHVHLRLGVEALRIGKRAVVRGARRVPRACAGRGDPYNAGHPVSQNVIRMRIQHLLGIAAGFNQPF
jgi:hypothetical protein